MKMRNKLIMITASSFLISISVKAQSTNDSIKSKINGLFKQFDNQNSPGAAVVIVKDGEIVYKKEFGIANLEYGIPIKSNSIFHIGSVSKQFTAFSILLLEDQGKLSLDDDIRIYLPEINEFRSKIKIRHLIHHTSGLREIEGLLQLCGISTADLIEEEQLMRLIIRQSDLNFNPGDELEYCNTGYILLAKIVERITDESFSQWTEKNIFKPLGMVNSQFYRDCTEIVKKRAYPYWIPADDKKLIKGILNYSYVGPTSVFTTSDDMAKWLNNFTQPKVGNEQIINKMLFETDTLNNGELLDYGYGIGVTLHKGHKVNLHSGHDAAYRAADLYFPEHNLGIAILSNFYSINPMEYGFKIADMFLEDKTVSHQSVDNKHTAKETEFEGNFSIQPKNLKEYEGKYFSNELQIIYDIKLQDTTLILTFWRNEDVVLTTEQNDYFTGNQWWVRKIKFSRNEKREIIGFKLTSGRVRTLKFQKI
jgi:CubicO group peptidase (beta-lactamase class C family)